MGGGDEFIKGVPMGLVCAINNIPVHWVGQPDRSATDWNSLIRQSFAECRSAIIVYILYCWPLNDLQKCAVDWRKKFPSTFRAIVNRIKVHRGAIRHHHCAWSKMCRQSVDQPSSMQWAIITFQNNAIIIIIGVITHLISMYSLAYTILQLNCKFLD